MSKFADLLHMLVDKTHFHDESQLTSAHALVDDATDELNPTTNAPTDAPTEPTDPVDTNNTVDTGETPAVKTESSVISNGVISNGESH